MEWLEWINDNREWVFSGIGAVIIGTVLAFFLKGKHASSAIQQTARSGDASQNIQAGRDVNIAVATDRPSANRIEILKTLDHSMNDMFGRLRTGLSENQFVRDFIVMSSRNVPGIVTHPLIRCNTDEIPELTGKVHILEGHGFIELRGNLYRMSEEFAAYLTIPTVNKVLPKDETELYKLAKSLEQGKNR